MLKLLLIVAFASLLIAGDTRPAKSTVSERVSAGTIPPFGSQRQAVAAGESSIDERPARPALSQTNHASRPLQLAMWQEEAHDQPQLTQSTKYYLQHLATAEIDLPAGEARFTALMQNLATEAAQRSERTSFVIENQAILTTLAITLGHPRVALIAGVGPQSRTIGQIQQKLGTIRLRGRRDWTQHFTVSAGLTALASPRLSAAVGVWKESIDSESGSGFSFSDLLADRAGIWFGTLATRDEETAQQIQQRMREGLQLEAIFPEAQDLPEGIAASELESKYGGVGGPRYQQLSIEIDRRLAACELFKAFLPQEDK
jgi:hypothetical protein